MFTFERVKRDPPVSMKMTKAVTIERRLDAMATVGANFNEPQPAKWITFYILLFKHTHTHTAKFTGINRVSYQTL